MGSKKLRFSEGFLLALGSGTYEVIKNPLPPDVRVIGREWDNATSCLVLVLESDQFHDSTDDLSLPHIKTLDIRTRVARFRRQHRARKVKPRV